MEFKEDVSGNNVSLFVKDNDGEIPLRSGESFANGRAGYYTAEIDGTKVSVKKMVRPSAPLTNQPQPARESGYVEDFDLSSNDVGDELSLGKYRPPEGNPLDVLGGVVFNNRPSEVELRAKIIAGIK